MVESRSILIADDEETFLKSTARLLSREGYSCECASNAEEAVEKLRTGRFDLLIADIKMPGNLGLALVEEAQRIAGGIPVILVTGYPSVDTAVTSVRLSVAAYLTKPLDYEELREHVRVLTQRSQDYRTISSVRDHLQKSVEELQEVERTGQTQGNGAQTPGLVSIVTLRTLASCLSELLRMNSGRCSHGISPDLCELLDCPQRPLHRVAIRETIAVLKKTRSTFKSKELGVLRTRLEQLLRNTETPSDGT
jgi:DNA-binding response OmpR family regulator